MGKHRMRAVPLVGIHAAEGKVRSGPPSMLRLRFPVGARVELHRYGEWLKGTIVSHWWRSTDRSWWIASEWAAYQIKMDASPEDEPVLYIGDDGVPFNHSP